MCWRDFMVIAVGNDQELF